MISFSHSNAVTYSLVTGTKAYTIGTYNSLNVADYNKVAEEVDRILQTPGKLEELPSVELSETAKQLLFKNKNPLTTETNAQKTTAPSPSLKSVAAELNQSKGYLQLNILC